MSGVASNAATVGGRRHKGVPVKTLKKMLKKAGLKTTGRKAALTRRAKKAHLKMSGGDDKEPEDEMPEAPKETASPDSAMGSAPDSDMGGRRRRSRKSGFPRLF
jgi:hypothetical protein